MKPQNLLILMSDEHNARMMGCAGDALAQTPNLDALAARGTRFTDAYTTCPICVPARASFATGRYIHDIGYWDNSIAYDGRVPSWGHRMQQAGVRVESIGKLHYRSGEDPSGFDRQHIPMHITGGVGMIQLSIRKQFPDFVPPPRRRAAIAESAGPGESEYTRYDRRVADIAVDWLRDAATSETPWVLFVSFVTPHYPLVAPKEFFDLYPVERMPEAKFGPGSGYQPHPWLADLTAGGPPRPEDQRVAYAAYLGLISFMDAQVGRVLGALDAAGLRDTTRIIYTSDHGENAGARGIWGKSNHYQEAVAVPMIVAGPNVPAGKLSATPASLADAYPSVLDCAGLPAEAGIPGRSLFELATKTDDRDRIVFSEYHAAASPSASYMIRKGRFKFIYYVRFAPELFDLEADPAESENLAARPEYAATVRELEAELRRILDPEEQDRRANEAQRLLIESKGGPDALMANLPTKKLYTPVPPELLS
ncbi:sulfatase-like hydrolase/transferase [Bradyrhizobium sp. GCM10027634]|uniref:sulfatase-like hydrolase/transferase n=1 Tax=unclassified Bradyrhizobium TaxID=2631580 RepID=UPI00263BA5AE|nr:sulfatase-like hydrolase/transferase [Bradyrhizobium sp. WYCCWR 12677]MDN5000007.1 sulfatase-like hydrolase/transferase [Bradyrhizobium sp. WYCCWR 12677]